MTEDLVYALITLRRVEGGLREYYQFRYEEN